MARQRSFSALGIQNPLSFELDAAEHWPVDEAVPVGPAIGVVVMGLVNGKELLVLVVFFCRPT